jgi:phosphoribosylamine--glycine ligase
LPCFPTTRSYLEIAQEFEADLTIVGPEAPLVEGVVDMFRAAGLRIIGPTAAAAQLEGSKVFSKAFMNRAGIPTAEAITTDSPEEATRHLDRFGFPVVMKADGLAAGKGVVIVRNKREALQALQNLPGGRILIEEFLEGEEVSFII